MNGGKWFVVCVLGLLKIQQSSLIHMHTTTSLSAFYLPQPGNVSVKTIQYIYIYI